MTQQIATVFEQAIREHPQDWHMLQRVFTADVEPPVAGAEPRKNEDRHRLPVLLGRPRGVQSHIRDLADALIEIGHEVSVTSLATRSSCQEPMAVLARNAAADVRPLAAGAGCARPRAVTVICAGYPVRVLLICRAVR